MIIKGEIYKIFDKLYFIDNKKSNSVVNFILKKPYGRGYDYLKCSLYNENICKINKKYENKRVKIRGYFDIKAYKNKKNKRFIVNDIEIIIK